MIESVYTNSTAERLSKLAELYEHGEAGPVMDRTIDKMLAQEAQEARSQLDQIQIDLAEFERQYGLSTEDFFRRFEAGATDDRMDFVEWASLAQMARNLERRLHLLAGGEEVLAWGKRFMRETYCG